VTEDIAHLREKIDIEGKWRDKEAMGKLLREPPHLVELRQRIQDFPIPDFDRADGANELDKLPGPIEFLRSRLPDVRQNFWDPVFEDNYEDITYSVLDVRPLHKAPPRTTPLGIRSESTFSDAVATISGWSATESTQLRRSTP
jgi:hypothetical protein